MPRVPKIASLPIGLILDRHGPRVTVLIGSVLFLLGGLLFSSSVYMLGFFLLGIGGPFIFIGVPSSFKRSVLRTTLLSNAFANSPYTFPCASPPRLGLSWLL